METRTIKTMTTPLIPTIMTASFLLSLMLTTTPVVDAFHVQPLKSTTTGSSITRHILKATKDDNEGNHLSIPPEFHRAIECAKDHEQGMCDVEELLRLADELEQYDGCMIDWKVDMTNNSSVEADCEKEMMDRLDIADLLRTEGELLERRSTMEFSNLFKEEVEEDERNKKNKEIIELYSGFYECMYSNSCGP